MVNLFFTLDSGTKLLGESGQRQLKSTSKTAKTDLTCAGHGVADVLTKLDGGDEVDGWGGREPERLEVGRKGTRGVLKIESRENQLVDRAACCVDQVQQLSIVSPGGEIFL